MKKTMLKLRILIIVFFLIYLVLTIKFSKGFIINFQIYSNLEFIPIMFWSFIILVFVTMLVGDTGFLKLGAVIGVITGVLILVFQMVNNTSTYDLMKSDNYTLIVETDSSPGERSVNVYTKDSLFFSKYVGNVKIQDIYDTSYEMIGDSFIINKCTLNSCVTVEIDLN